MAFCSRNFFKLFQYNICSYIKKEIFTGAKSVTSASFHFKTLYLLHCSRNNECSSQLNENYCIFCAKIFIVIDILWKHNFTSETVLKGLCLSVFTVIHI